MLHEPEPDSRCAIAIATRVPAQMAYSIERAAAGELISVAEFTRRALARQLKADGFDSGERLNRLTSTKGI